VTYERMKAKVDEALKAHFRPEFLNRIDEVIVFHELSRAEVAQIVDLLMARTVKQLSDQGIGLELTPAARTFLADRGYDPQLGARPLRRAIQQLVEDPLSERILWKEFRVGETIVIDVEQAPIEGEGPQLSFTAVQGVEEPPPLELAGAGADTE
jgi:ATP-dependent Clp protease ATP-binding subunit ClpC